MIGRTGCYTGIPRNVSPLSTLGLVFVLFSRVTLSRLAKSMKQFDSTKFCTSRMGSARTRVLGKQPWLTKMQPSRGRHFGQTHLPVRLDRLYVGRGLIIYIDDQYKSKVICNLNTYQQWKGLVVKVQSNLSKTVTIGNIYRSPRMRNEDLSAFIDEFTPIISSLEKTVIMISLLLGISILTYLN